MTVKDIVGLDEHEPWHGVCIYLGRRIRVMSEQTLGFKEIRIVLTLPDAKALLTLLRTSPDTWPDVIEALEDALQP